MKPETQILLATYNGGNFLEEQLESILDQTYTDWEILARDDGSTDDTVEILREFQKAHPNKMTIIEDNNRNLGHCQNFGLLMENSSASTICFAD
jgi:glycosyltransferase involved in cell wall biosynthesis